MPTYLDYLEATGESRQQLLATDMNDAGIIVGNYMTDDGLGRSFVWAPVDDPDQEEGLDLGALGGAWVKAVDIADNGTVAGTAQTASGSIEAFVWTPSAGIQAIGTLGGFSSQAVALSKDGSKLVGNSQVIAGQEHAFILGGGEEQRVSSHNGGDFPASADIVEKGIAFRTMVKEKIDKLVPDAKDYVNGSIEKIKALRPRAGERPNADELLRASSEMREKYQALSDEAKESLRTNFPKIHSLF